MAGRAGANGAYAHSLHAAELTQARQSSRSLMVSITAYTSEYIVDFLDQDHDQRT